MKVVAIVGSISEQSKNKKLAEFMQKRFKDKLDIEIMLLNDMPMYNEDIELNPPAVVDEMRKQIRESEGLLILTPEYNHSIPGVLKNALDWFSRVERVMLNKPTMIVGASMGALGTVKAQLHLREILNSGGVGAITLPRNEVFIGSIQDKVDEEGYLNDESTIQFLDTVVEQFIDWAKKIQ
ncbi:NADPH-dependent FMN reductase [Alkaliphilus oremlandii]|uniref:NADPH-dependent FMN reductase n=1 Tax=Alkaliphilus oremlandii (strain OhILAs) TaxID=350688 RepID=A8MLQ9_ALKOO|nr:NADPH-dependent FMN reductase [Alkaliphilus oremlandii]ABW17976.1 NADPH-dependent FMN reductase [Alkaliphilus oremlandii OhILAs]